MEAPAQRAFATFIPNAPPPESRRLRRTWKNLLLCAILVPSKGAADDTLEVRTLRSPAEPRGCSARIGYNLTYRTGADVLRSNRLAYRCVRRIAMIGTGAAGLVSGGRVWRVGEV